MSNLIKINHKLPSVQFNKEQLTALINEELALITNDASLNADQARKAVRALVKNFDDQRKDITRGWDAYKKQFMSDVSDALSPAHEYDKELTEYINEVETQRKLDKVKAIEDIEGYQLFKQYHADPDKWFLKGTSLDDIREDINNANQVITAQLTAIKSSAIILGLEPTTYIELRKSREYDDIVARMNEDKQLVDSFKEVKQEPIIHPRDDEKPFTLVRRLTGTKSQFELLKAYAEKINIKIEKEGAQ